MTNRKAPQTSILFAEQDPSLLNSLQYQRKECIFMGRGLTGDCKNTGVRGMAVILRQSDEGLPPDGMLSYVHVLP